MKSRILLMLAIIAFIASCQEKKPPGLDLVEMLEENSSYTAPIEAKQDKVVLIEKLTGVSCANCPQATTVIKTLQDANPNRVLVANMHPPSNGFAEPIYGKSKLDFRHPEVDEIGIKLGGLGSLPSAALNRERITSGKIYDKERGAWSTRIKPWLKESTPVNIHINSTYKADNNTCEVITKVAFTENVSEELYLTMYVIENGLVDYQKKGLQTIPDYNHEHIFRDCITSVAGSSLNFSDKEAGTVLQKRVEFNPIIEGVNGWNLDNCKIIAFVHKSGTDQAIIHAQEVKLK